MWLLSEGLGVTATIGIFVASIEDSLQSKVSVNDYFSLSNEKESSRKLMASVPLSLWKIIAF